MNKKMKWIGLMAAVLLIVSCFTPWVIIESKSITISGIDATGTNYGKPGYFHFVFCFFFLSFTFIPKVWAKRFNLLVVAINVAWATKNYFMITTCAGGECPAPQTGLWLMLLASLVMFLSSFFPDISLNKSKNNVE